MSRPAVADESGQVLALFAAGLLVVLLGFMGVVVDVAAWYQAQRHVQAVADAAALAAVRELPGSTGAAAAAARAYAASNAGVVAAPRFSRTTVPDDTVTVEASQTAPVYFTRLFGIRAPIVHASATAAASAAASVADAVPISIDASTPALACGPPCYGQETTLDFGSVPDAGGAFGLLDFSEANGNVSPATLAGWIASGYPGDIALGAYSSPGNRWNAAAVVAALSEVAAQHRIVLVPVHTSVAGDGANALYTIGGFAAFRVDSYDSGSDSLTGAFVAKVVATGAVRGQGARYYGVSATRLVR